MELRFRAIQPTGLIGATALVHEARLVTKDEDDSCLRGSAVCLVGVKFRDGFGVIDEFWV